MNLTNIILGKIIQTQKRTNSIKLEKDKIYAVKSQTVVTWVGELASGSGSHGGFWSVDNALFLDLSEKPFATSEKMLSSQQILINLSTQP